MRDVVVSGDLFLLVYSIDCRASFNEVKRLLEQLLQVKQQATSTGPTSKKVPMPVLLVANKCDKERDRDVSLQELKELADSFQVCLVLYFFLVHRLLLLRL